MDFSLFTLHFSLLATIALAVVSCGKSDALKPRSGGSPYEVLVMTGDSELRKAVDSVLTQDVPQLPQSEPMFNVSHSETSELTQATRYARSVVMLRRDAAVSKPKMSYERNVYAEPQVIVNVTVASSSDFRRIAPQIVTLLQRFELRAMAESLQHDQNTQATKRVERLFGHKITVPRELTATKEGKDFVWLSDNGNTVMGNLCVYSFESATMDAATLIRKRDSVMAVNIPGEEPQMHMATERRHPVTATMAADGVELRGLWQMENDAMGGPFVCKAVRDTRTGRVVVAEAFVYAPGRDKRHKLRRLEAAVMELRIKN